MEEKCAVEVFWSVNGEYHAFLRENSPVNELGGRSHLHILKTYGVSGFSDYEKIVKICNKSAGKPAEYVEEEIEKLLEE